MIRIVEKGTTPISKLSQLSLPENAQSFLDDPAAVVRFPQRPFLCELIPPLIVGHFPGVYSIPSSTDEHYGEE